MKNNPRNPQLMPNDEIDPRDAKFKEHHLGFQFGTNPMAMSKFETELVQKEKNQRYDNKKKYILGIQGMDGGEHIYN
jgi:hypothetical protein